MMSSLHTNDERRNSTGPFPCPFCDRKFLSRQALGGHKKAHLGKRKVRKSGSNNSKLGFSDNTNFGHLLNESSSFQAFFSSTSHLVIPSLSLSFLEWLGLNEAMQLNPNKFLTSVIGGLPYSQNVPGYGEDQIITFHTGHTLELGPLLGGSSFFMAPNSYCAYRVIYLSPLDFSTWLWTNKARHFNTNLLTCMDGTQPYYGDAPGLVQGQIITGPLKPAFESNSINFSPFSNASISLMDSDIYKTRPAIPFTQLDSSKWLVSNENPQLCTDEFLTSLDSSQPNSGEVSRNAEMMKTLKRPRSLCDHTVAAKLSMTNGMEISCFESASSFIGEDHEEVDLSLHL